MMRRMKIRAKPNVGIGGGGASRNSSVPGRGSAATGTAQGSKTQVQTTSSAMVEEAASTSARDTDQPTGESVEVTSGPRDISRDVLSVDLQEGTNKSYDDASSATTSASPQMNTKPCPSEEETSQAVGSASEEHQLAVTNSTSDSPSTDSRVTPETPDSYNIPIAAPEAQPSPVSQDSPSAKTPADVSVDEPVCVPVSPPPPSAPEPASDTNNVSKGTQQDSEGKSAVCMRRKKLKVKPMLGGLRKGNAVDKAKSKPADANTNVPSVVKSECVNEKHSVSQMSNEENVSTQGNTGSSQQNLEMLERVDTDADTSNISRKPTELGKRTDYTKKTDKVIPASEFTPTKRNEPVVVIDTSKKTDVVILSSECSEVSPSKEREVQEVREVIELKDTVPERTRDEVEVVKDSTSAGRHTTKPIEADVVVLDNSHPTCASQNTKQIKSVEVEVVKDNTNTTAANQNTKQTEDVEVEVVKDNTKSIGGNRITKPTEGVEVEIVKENTKSTTGNQTTKPREGVEVEVLDTITTTVANQTTKQAGGVVPSCTTSTTTSTSTSAAVGSKRRARIRAQPTLVMKKRKEDDKDKLKPAEQTPATNEPLKDVPPLDIAKKCEATEPEAATVELSAKGSEGQVQEKGELGPSTDASQEEVKCLETESTRKQSQLSNITDKVDKDIKEKESEQIKREGLIVNLKENTESPLKTSRKKRLNENKGVKPELEVVDVVNTSVEKQGKKRPQPDDNEEIVNSDDSTGDKENASMPISELSKQERCIKENSSSPQKAKAKTPVQTSKLFGKYEKKPKVEDDPDSPDKAKKQIFRARKSEFRKKMSNGAMERSKMTMFDLIYWNPSTNPMPGRAPSPKRNSGSNSRGETDSVTSETAEEERADDLGLDAADSEHQSRPESPEIVNVTDKSPEKPSEETKDSTEEEKDPGEDSVPNEEEENGDKDIFAPRVKIGPNGEIMVDEQSIKIQTTAAKNRDEVLSKAKVVEESGDSSHYGRWSKRRRRSFEWTVKETALFYKALSTVGTDFSLMETLIKWRTRAELKTKFKKEERNHRDLVDLALNDSTQFDMTVFEEESGYDPKEDRKAARQAERAEAKRRRLAMKQQDKIQLMEKKKLENKKNKAMIKKRKKALRKAYRNRGRKRKELSESDAEDSPSLDDSDSGLEDSPEEPQPRDLVPARPRVALKRRQAKRRNSLVISEVTVTMETVRYEKPSTNKPAEDEGITERTVMEHETVYEGPAIDEPAGDEGGTTEQTVKQHITTPELVLPKTSEEAGLSDCLAPEETHKTHPSKSSECPASPGMVKEKETHPSKSLDCVASPGIVSEEEAAPSKSPECVASPRSNKEEQDEQEEMNLLNEYPQLPLSEGLPESHIIENLIYENPENADTDPDIDQMDEGEGQSSGIEAGTKDEGGADSAEVTMELQPSTPDAEPDAEDEGADSQRVWHFPVSAIQVLEDGQQVIVVPTSNGQYSVPVPVLPPGTSNIVVMATEAPDFPGELIYHVYLVSPLEAGTGEGRVEAGRLV